MPRNTRREAGREADDSTILVFATVTANGRVKSISKHVFMVIFTIYQSVGTPENSEARRGRAVEKGREPGRCGF